MSEEKVINNYDLLAKYLNSECDSDEIKQVEDWINSSFEHRLEFEKLSRAWELAAAGYGFGQWHAKDSKESFLLKVIQNQAGIIGEKENLIQNTRRQIVVFWKYAAVAILIMGLSSLWVFTRPGSLTEGTFTEIAVPKGSKSQMSLPDGTQVWLNADSKIKYAPDFNVNDRNINLVGEAYFEVAKNQSKTFSVNAGGLIVEAVGTAFNVKAYPEENVVEATLVEGLINVGLVDKSKERLALKPNEQLFYYKSGQGNNQSDRLLVSKGIGTSSVTSWMKGQLEINGETLKSIAVKLSRQYDVKIQFEDANIEDLRFTGVFNNETIEQILEVIKISSPVNYRIHDREIWLSRKPNSKTIAN